MASLDSVRTQKPVRFRKARSDARLAAIQETIETKLGLPTGCVRIIAPSGRKMRKDATVRRLKNEWNG